MKKFTLLLNDTIIVDGQTLFRIEMTESTTYAKLGQKGGYVWGYDAINGNSWVDVNAKLCGAAKIYDKVKVYDNAVLSGNAEAYGNAHIFDNAHVYENSRVYGNAIIRGASKIYENARVCGDAVIDSNAEVSGYIYIKDNALIRGKVSKYYIHVTLFNHTITMCEDGITTIGCITKHINNWIELYKSIGILHKYSYEDIDSYGFILKSLQEIYNQRK